MKFYNNVTVSDASFGTVTFNADDGSTLSLPYDVLINGLPSWRTAISMTRLRA